MPVAYVLTTRLREDLKRPLGVLIRGSFSETIDELKQMILTRKPASLIAVGDMVTKSMEDSGLLPGLEIVDNIAMRKAAQKFELTVEKKLPVDNPPGTITEEAVVAIQKAIRSDKRVAIIVDGEEDLLALIAILYAPEGSLVVYGQPREGIVAVYVNSEKKKEIIEILKEMQHARKAK